MNYSQTDHTPKQLEHMAEENEEKFPHLAEQYRQAAERARRKATEQTPITRPTGVVCH